MKPVLIFGAGRVGSLSAFLLAEGGGYEVILADVKDPAPQLGSNKGGRIQTRVLDVTDEAALEKVIVECAPQALISCLPYYCNLAIARAAKRHGLHYFDTTEDVATATAIKDMAADARTALVPHCGLAPGFIAIVANELMQGFDRLETAKLRVGCLPQVADNALKYALTWSTEGLINEYGNFCEAVVDGRRVQLPALTGLETVEVGGEVYEAFHTSGGIGDLVKKYGDRLKNLDYKTLRYPGHCEKIRFLMGDLRLNEDRATLKRILEHALPATQRDVALVYVTVTGMRGERLSVEHYVKKFYARRRFDRLWSALQVTTASSLCAVVDLVLTAPARYHGYVAQEQFRFSEVLGNRFGRVFSTEDQRGETAWTS